MKNLLLPFLMILCLVSCTNVKEPEFRRVENFRIRNFGFTEVGIGFQTTYFNPNKFGVSVKEAAADVYIDSIFLGRFVQDSAIQVGSNNEFSIPLSGSIPTEKALKINLKDIGEREILLQADGSVRVGKAGIFVTKPFKYEGRHRLGDLKLNQIRF